MKKSLSKNFVQLLICGFCLVFVATLAHAYTPPVSAPGNGNTDAPLNVSSLNQTKGTAAAPGGLSVGTFEARQDGYFDQNTFFNGMVLGGTAANAGGQPVTFGGTANKVDALFTGGVAINGVYQSDTLKTPDGKLDPICADIDGTIYVCGQTPPSGVGSTSPIYLTPQIQTIGGNNYAIAFLSQAIDKGVTVQIGASLVSSIPVAMRLKNAFTADAAASGSCSLTKTPTPLSPTLTIYAGDLSSYDPSLPSGAGQTDALPSGCDPSQIQLTVLSYSVFTYSPNYDPHKTPEGRSIVTNTNNS